MTEVQIVKQAKPPEKPKSNDKQHILIVEDESDICELLQYVLEREGFRVTCVNNGAEALALVLASTQPNQDSNHRPFNLVVMDIMLPGMDGLTLCRKLRENFETCRLPLVMLTAKSEESDVVVGLEVGADDYLSKPFSPKELVARIRAVLRRVVLDVVPSPDIHVAPSPGIRVGPIVIDQTRHVVTVRENAVQLTLAEFKLLALLMSRPGRVFSRDQILEQISGSEVYVIDRNVDVHIRAIRKKFGDDAEFIETVRGVGYKCREA